MIRACYKETDQPAYRHSLITILAVRTASKNVESLAINKRQRRLWSARMRRLIWFFAGRTYIVFSYWTRMQTATALDHDIGSHGHSIWATLWENVPSDMCAQRRLKSACASAQSDQSLHCPHEDTFHPWLPEMRPEKILIWLRECEGWSEISLGVLRKLSCTA